MTKKANPRVQENVAREGSRESAGVILCDGNDRVGEVTQAQRTTEFCRKKKAEEMDGGGR